MTARSRLPERRAALVFEFEHPPPTSPNGVASIRYTAHVGFYGDGRIGELFLSSEKVGSAADGIARDAGLLFSLLVQRGCPIDEIRDALTRGNDGKPDGVLGRALALIGERAFDEVRIPKGLEAVP